MASIVVFPAATLRSKLPGALPARPRRIGLGGQQQRQRLFIRHGGCLGELASGTIRPRARRRLAGDVVW